MNLIDAKVTKILSKIKQRIKSIEGTSFTFYWTIDVEYIDMGGTGKETLVFNDLDKAKEIKEGHIFQH